MDNNEFIIENMDIDNYQVDPELKLLTIQYHKARLKYGGLRVGEMERDDIMDIDNYQNNDNLKLLTRKPPRGRNNHGLLKSW